MEDTRKKLSLASVLGKITVHDANTSERIGQWGGTETFLSREHGHGPCLVVRKASAKKTVGVRMKLSGLKQILGTHAPDGQVTVQIRHMTRDCLVYISTKDDITNLQQMCNMLRRPDQWDAMERDVLNPNNPTAKRIRDEAADATLDGTGAQHHYFEPIEGEAGGAAYPYGMPQNEPDSYIHMMPVDTVNGGRTEEQMSAEQQRAANLVERGKSIFVTGAGGTGKSEWVRYMVSKLKGGDTVAITASTGVAARRIGGVTVHSFAGIGQGNGSLDDILKRVKSKPEAVRSWQRCQTWLIDEVSMIPGDLLDTLDAVARHVRNQLTVPFGGIQVIFTGDFLQLPPVASNGAPITMAFQSRVWKEVAPVEVVLTENFRQCHDPEFFEALNDIRMGEYTAAVERVLRPRVNAVIEVVGGNITEPTKIMSRNTDVDSYNEQKLKELDGEFRRFRAVDSTSIATIDLDSETPLPSLLTLKPGAKVIVVTNPREEPRVKNGDVGEVVSFVETPGHEVAKDMPVVRFSLTGLELVIHPTTIEVNSRNGTVLASREQLPLRLAWAVTVHRFQGTTLPAADITLDSSFFEYGQAYSAVSRVGTRAALRLSGFDPKVIRALPEAVQYYDHLAEIQRKKERLRELKEGLI